MATYSIRQDGLGDFVSIQDFFNAATNGDVGVIEDSATYAEAVTVPAGLQDVTLTVAQGQSPKWTSTGRLLTIPGTCSGIVIEGPSDGLLEIQSGANYSAIELQGCSNTTLRRLKLTQGYNLLYVSATTSGVTVEDCQASPSNELLWLSATLTSLIVRRCVLSGTYFAYYGAGTYIDGLTLDRVDATWLLGELVVDNTVLVRNCLIRYRGTSLVNEGYALRVVSQSVNMAAQVQHCTIVRPDDLAVFGYGVGADLAAGALTVRNTIVYRLDTGFDAGDVDYSHAASCTTAYGAGATVGANMVDPAQDPAFADTVSGDYHLQTTSPDMDAGVDLGVVEDLDGNPRPSGAAPDIGAYEVQVDVTVVEPEKRQSLVYATDLQGNPLPGFDDPQVGAVGPVDLVTLAHLVLVSTWTDRRAEASDKLPGGETDPRGWWADTYSDTPLGSRLWLLYGQPVDDTLARQVKAYVEEALQWMLDDGLATDIQVEVEVGGDAQARQVRLQVTVVRDESAREGVTLTWPELWVAYE